MDNLETWELRNLRTLQFENSKNSRVIFEFSDIKISEHSNLRSNVEVPSLIGSRFIDHDQAFGILLNGSVRMRKTRLRVQGPATDCPKGLGDRQGTGPLVTLIRHKAREMAVELFR